ncbi:MAG: triose-phosphate isomerase [Bacteroidetes bacterium]|nr:triose-phosphate isomerase [Bacteroidota bacterium]
MGRKKIVAGNWKMNTNLNEALALINDIQKGSKQFSQVEKIIFPPFPFLKNSVDSLTNETTFYVGAQNCSEHIKGAFTGEVSAEMLKSVGCIYVLVGHSERRTFFKESDEQLILKIQNALKNDLQVIFCFGEKLEERKAGRHFETVKKQIENVLKNFSETELNKFYLAYEPVWAIGTGETATPQQAQEMHAYIRKIMSELFSNTLSQNMPILYGGSCNAQNAKELFSCADVDGGLIGGASLKAADFCKIIASF